MSDSLREDILKSEAGQRMIETVTPIYDNSYVALWMFEAMGREWDSFVSIIESLKTELNIETATWMLPLWERRYGVPTDVSLTLEERRQQIRLKRMRFGAISPFKIWELAKNMTGLEAQVNEYIPLYTFEVVLPYISKGDSAFRKKLRKVKPSHLACMVNYELSQTVELYRGVATMSSARIGILLPNEEALAEDDLGEAVLFPANNAVVTIGMDYHDPQDQIDMASVTMLSSNILAVGFTVQ